jgi:hypothetical protein
VWATGGRGADNPAAGAKGGAGGNGGAVDVVARTLGTVVSIVADGGDGGDYGADQGPGGAGGAIHGFTDGALLDDLKVVQADGGDGNPLGPSGARTQESSPASLAIGAGGVLSWTSRSPGASRFRVLRAVGDGPFEVAGETVATSLALTTPLCTPIRATVVAVHDGVRWTSDQPAAASYTAQPSATQRCGDPAGIAFKERKLKRRLRTVRKAKWRINVELTPSGLGKLDATLQRGKKKVERLSTTAAQLKPGAPVVLRFTLPKGKRRHGRFAVVLVVSSPDGTRRTTTTVPLEVLKK